MPPFTFTYGPRVRSGPGASADLASLLPNGPVLFVTDRGVRRLGLAHAALAGLAEPVVFDAVEADPSRATLETCVAAGREAGARSIVGFGGGSPMDVAKLAAYLLGSGDDLDGLWGVGKATGARLPLVLVPTTAGTGSEATPVTIISDAGEKRGVSSPALVADWALLDASLTLGLPRHVTAATGIDAMVHAIEAYTSAKLKNPLSDALAREALRLLVANVRTACDEPGNAGAREAMLLGAHLAGVAFANAPVAAVHALAYPLGGRFGVPHGLSNALMLEQVLEHNMAAAAPLYAELGPILDPSVAGQGSQARARALVEGLRAIGEACGVPRTLREVGVRAEHLDDLAADAMKQERLLVNNPREVTLVDARRMYAAAL